MLGFRTYNFEPSIIEPKNSVGEVTERRASHSKTFLLDTGQSQLEARIGRVHFEDTSGNLQDIDPTIVKVGNIYMMDKSTFKIETTKSGIGFKFTSRKTGGTITVLLTALDDIPLPSNLKPKITLDKNRLLFQDVVADLDICIQVRPSKYQIFKILKDNTAPHKLTWEITEKGDLSNSFVQKETKGRDNKDATSLRNDELYPRRNIDIKHTITSLPGLPDENNYLFTEDFSSKKSAKTDKNTRETTWETDTVYPVLIDADVTEYIEDGDDDGWEENSKWYTDVYGGGAYHHLSASANDNYHSGWRFRTVNIAQGVTIDSATITIRYTQDSMGTNTAVTIYADDVDNAATWANNSGPTDMTKTTAKAEDTIPESISVPEADVFTVTSVVQEIVSRGGWAANNAMRFGAMNDGSTGYGYHRIYDYAEGSTNCPYLSVTYSVGGRTTKNTDAFPLGDRLGESFRM